MQTAMIMIGGGQHPHLHFWLSLELDYTINHYKADIPLASQLKTENRGRGDIDPF